VIAKYLYIYTGGQATQYINSTSLENFDPDLSTLAFLDKNGVPHPIVSG